ncbi:MAG TPA: hypothetical protein VK530_02910 [Candidatus Acidoferrum sp.]|nr:hypothetical protein [Candidatus Acidoferrum sp.]
MKLLRHCVAIVCLVATFIAHAGEQPTAKGKCIVNPPTNAELQALQGTWEEIVVGDKGTSKNPDLQNASKPKPGEIDFDFLKIGVLESPPQPREKITITITGDSFHFHRDTNFWFETTITVPAGKDPKQLHATIKGGPPSQAGSIGEVVRAFFKIEDGTLTLAAIGGAEETPKGFEAAVENRYELRKVHKKMSGSGLGSLVLEGPELHASLKTGPIDDDSVRHVKRAPGNPHVSTNAAFVTGIARGASQGSLGSEGIRSVLYALYREKHDLGFYGLEAVSAADADRWEKALRKTWSVMGSIGHAQVHRKGLVIVVVWNDGVSPECWKAVNAKVVERLSGAL